MSKPIHRTKHWIPLTYKPKIAGVLEGRIRQTIRPKRTYQKGDQVAFHGWAGVPYRSPWSFRTPYFTLTEVVPIIIWQDGISSMVIPDWKPRQWFWSWEKLNRIAEDDGIQPATGAELGRVLSSYHAIPEQGMEGQILRWRP